MKRKDKIKRGLLWAFSTLALLLAVGVAYVYWPVSENRWKRAAVLLENDYYYTLQGENGTKLCFSSCDTISGLANLSFEAADCTQKQYELGYFVTPFGRIRTSAQLLAPAYDSLYFKKQGPALLAKITLVLTRNQQLLAHEIKELNYYLSTHFSEDDGFEEMKSLLANRMQLKSGQDSLLHFVQQITQQPGSARWNYVSKVRAYYSPNGARRVYLCAKLRWKERDGSCQLVEKALPQGAGFIVNPTFSLADMQLSCDSLVQDSSMETSAERYAAALQTSTGIRYVGEVVGCSPDGMGKSTAVDGQTYQGYWVKGRRHGHGAYCNQTATRYVGDWQNNSFMGGEVTYPDGSLYRGSLLNDSIRDGAGEMLYADGSIYQGTWQDGIRQGFGMYVGAADVAKCGMWKNDKFQGERLLYTADRVYGIDISRYQHIGKRKRACNIAWKYLRITNLGHLSKKRVKEPTVSYPVSFAYIKSTEGATVRNAYYKADRLQAKKYKILTGAYHFFTSAPVDEQLKWFFKQTIYQKGDMPPMLDLEPTDHYIQTRWGSDEVMFERVLHWLRAVEKHYGVKPLLYVNQSFIMHHLVYAPKELQSYDLWVARYGEFKPYTHMVYWQLSPDGRVSGIQSTVDINVFNGSKERFTEYVKSFSGSVD